jgi:hypothetical protein
MDNSIPFHLLIGKLRRWKDLQLPLYRALARLGGPTKMSLRQWHIFSAGAYRRELD